MERDVAAELQCRTEALGRHHLVSDEDSAVRHKDAATRRRSLNEKAARPRRGADQQQHPAKRASSRQCGTCPFLRAFHANHVGSGRRATTRSPIATWRGMALRRAAPVRARVTFASPNMRMKREFPSSW